MELEGSQIDLLISILIRFPQINTIHYEPDPQALRLVFLVKDPETDFHTFSHTFETHLALFHRLQRKRPLVSKFKKTENNGLFAFEVVRDLGSLSLEELNLITELIDTCFTNSVVKEGTDVLEEEEFEHNLLIEALLRSGSRRRPERLTGFREDGRVLVFSIPFTEVNKI